MKSEQKIKCSSGWLAGVDVIVRGMSRRSLALVLGAGLLMLFNTGCSSIMTGGTKKVKLSSMPSGADVQITDEKGKHVFSGKTPTEARLKTGKAYFRTKKYDVAFSKEGFRSEHQQLKSTFSPWYAGNILFGGLVGLVVVDPLTGAVYTLKGDVSAILQPDSGKEMTHWSPDSSSGPILLSQVPEAYRDQLVLVSQP